MPATRADLMTRLDRLSIATETRDHPAVFTVAESEALHERMPGGHTKNLFLKDAKGRLFLLIAESHASIDMKSLHKLLDCKRLSFGKPDLLMQTLGVEPGSVTAFAVINDPDCTVEVCIDRTLMDYGTINCHPLENTATTAIARDDLLAFLESTGHAPKIVSLDGDGPPESP